MLIAALITLIIVAALGYAFSSRRDGVIVDHPYNNLYNDATAAREDHLG
jgi:hypothetical protein